MNDWTIRDSTDSDVDALRDVFRRASLSNPGDRPLLVGHPEHLVWSPAPSLATRVAVVDGSIAGFASTTGPVAGVAELEDLFVAPESMRSGVGRALIADAGARVRTLGARAIEVTGNEHALAFYEAVGFVRIGTAPTAGGNAPRLRLALD